jgi:hypothetical protein
MVLIIKRVVMQRFFRRVPRVIMARKEIFESQVERPRAAVTLG